MIAQKGSATHKKDVVGSSTSKRERSEEEPDILEVAIIEEQKRRLTFSRE